MLMGYQKVTTQLIALIRDAATIIDKISEANELCKNGDSKKAVDEIKELRSYWYSNCITTLSNNDLFLELEDFDNYIAPPLMRVNLNPELNEILNYMQNRKAILINFAKELEKKQNKEVILLKIEDFDNFEVVRGISLDTVKEYCKDAFLEDDVEDAFLEAVGEPYKELDSGAETRDLFTDRLLYKQNRLSTAVMFKGRGQKGELTIDKCGLKGNQLLKLAKNNSAECFIVQHTNKINPDVKEALQDHILQNTRLSKIYICFIDGLDTARLLKSLNKDLEELKNKKSNGKP